MVVASLTFGAVVGVLLSAGFIWWEVGRYAAPQVPVTVFDERKVLAAYTVGLFVGVPLAAAYVLLTVALTNAALPGAAALLIAVVGGGEAAQRFLVRSRYWGAGPAVPFYAVSFRAGVGGILALAAVAEYLGSVAAVGAVGLCAALLTATALVALEVASGFLSLRPRAQPAARTPGPLAAALFCAVAFFLLGIGPSAGPAGALLAPVIVLGGSAVTFRGRRGLLAEVPAPGAPLPAESPERDRTYGRTAPLPESSPTESMRK